MYKGAKKFNLQPEENRGRPEMTKMLDLADKLIF